MTWLSEDPTFIIICGVILTAILTTGLIKTGRGSLLFAIGGVIALTVALIVLERLWVTDFEKIENRLYATAEALETNDPDQILLHVSPDAVALRLLVKTVLPTVSVDQIGLSNVQITVNELTTPPTANVEFLALVKGSYRGQQSLYEKTPFRLHVELEKIGEEWLISGYPQGPLSQGRL